MKYFCTVLLHTSLVFAVTVATQKTPVGRWRKVCSSLDLQHVNYFECLWNMYERVRLNQTLLTEEGIDATRFYGQPVAQGVYLPRQRDPGRVVVDTCPCQTRRKRDVQTAVQPTPIQPPPADYDQFLPDPKSLEFIKHTQYRISSMLDVGFDFQFGQPSAQSPRPEDRSPKSDSNSQSIYVFPYQAHDLLTNVQHILSTNINSTADANCNFDLLPRMVSKSTDCGLDWSLWQWGMDIPGIINTTTCNFVLTCTQHNYPRCLPGCCSDDQCKYCITSQKCPTQFPQHQVMGEWVWRSDCFEGDRTTCGGAGLVQSVSGPLKPWSLDDVDELLYTVQNFYEQEGVSGVHSLADDHWLLDSLKPMLSRKQNWHRPCFGVNVDISGVKSGCLEVSLYQFKVTVGPFEVTTCDYVVVCDYNLKPKCLPFCCVDRTCQTCRNDRMCPSAFPQAPNQFEPDRPTLNENTRPDWRHFSNIPAPRFSLLGGSADVPLGSGRVQVPTMDRADPLQGTEKQGAEDNGEAVLREP